ncbi:integrator complex subunit 12-like isoform X2 [Artemia franciscana]|uniref:integrator complex subunit 12-like isoform X2 n=1 Tax=Artemia franciscana TaxID=6661 RepID=UPI0032DBD21A
MASSDLDPAFQKALVLLHSKSKDSAEQMKALLEDFLRLKTGKEVKVKLPVNPPAKLIAKTGGIPVVDQELKRKSEKNEDLFDVPLSLRDNKRLKLDESSTKKATVAEEADDLVSEIMDFACLVCKGLDVSSGNQLVECRECSALYHQECHKPPISEQDVLAFTCTACLRSPKKLGQKTSGASGIKPSKSDAMSSISTSSSGKDLSYKKSEKDKSSSSSKSSSSYSSKVGPHSPSSKSSSSGKSSKSLKSSSSSVTSTGFLQDADKRLQMLKKKAATKLTEKRKGK